jgi:hypothetical protein
MITDGSNALVSGDRPNVRLVARPNLLTDSTIDVVMPEGLTVGQMLDASGMDPRMAPWCVVLVDGAECKPEQWDRVRPKAGHRLTVIVYPTGGGNGGDSNKTLRVVLQIVVYVAAAVLTYLTGNPLWFYAAAAASIALQFLLPPSFPRRKSQEGATQSPSIQGARNRFPGFGDVVPRPLGWHRVIPPVRA